MACGSGVGGVGGIAYEEGYAAHNNESGVFPRISPPRGVVGWEDFSLAFVCLFSLRAWHNGLEKRESTQLIDEGQLID